MIFLINNNVIKKQLIYRIVEIVGKDNFLISASEMAPFKNGWRTQSGECKGVITPSTLLEMWKIIKLLVKNNKIILMQASNTSLTGGSTPNGKYDRELFIINTLKLNNIYLINKAEQIVALPGSTLYSLENKLRKFNRAPHSEIGSSCIGASIVGGICNNSGGALIKRGPAYTELSLFAQVNNKGELKLINNLGIDLGKTPEQILKKIDNGDIPKDKYFKTRKKASSYDYKKVIKDVNANSPARFNADKKRLFQASGCAGKIAVFAVRLDTFEKEKNEVTFYLSSNSPKDLTLFRRRVLQEVTDLPIYAEYIHREAYKVSKKYGKDAFLLIYYLGTSVMPIFYKIKSRIEKFFSNSRLFSNYSLDYILQYFVKIIPHPLSKKFDKINDKYEHHLIVKFDASIYSQIKFLASEIFKKKSKANFLHCTLKESKKLTLTRFVIAGANVRFARVHPKTNNNLLALDISLRRNDKNWNETLPKYLKKLIYKPIYVGHYFCHVFHREYALNKGVDPDIVKSKLLSELKKAGAKYPAEHNVGHSYIAEKNLKDFYKKLDPTNTFNPGIGKTSKKNKL
ncbi:MAG: D-lactate dehydrogenase [Alphaproteobacteria bacterium MarineAlpha9_Bin4]|nr:MAG: D-lactate dehydrogenase [Alphaproteobacteria bacterium MarineAlpha9_Bin4]